MVFHESGGGGCEGEGAGRRGISEHCSPTPAMGTSDQDGVCAKASLPGTLALGALSGTLPPKNPREARCSGSGCRRENPTIARSAKNRPGS